MNINGGTRARLSLGILLIVAIGYLDYSVDVKFSLFPIYLIRK